MKKKNLIFVLLAAVLLFQAGCGSTKVASSASASEGDTSAQVADSAQMAPVEEVVDENMVPVYADSLTDGTYSVIVDSSSEMFNIVSCALTVADGKMTATMTMGGTGYLYVYMGTGEEAAEASEESYIPFAELSSGEHTFTVPVEALDKGIDCAAFSKKKERWYDRTLVFRADSLGAEAFATGLGTSVESLNLADGSYTVDVTLEGGSGKASVASPAVVNISDGQATATIVWSSDKYDYMKIGDVQYDAVTTDGGSTFEIPVSGFDFKMPVIADTLAMGAPHEIAYTLQFDSASIAAVNQ